MHRIEIIAIDKKTGERVDVSERMYFFEEKGIQSINTGNGHHCDYAFEIIITVWPKGAKGTR